MIILHIVDTILNGLVFMTLATWGATRLAVWWWTL